MVNHGEGKFSEVINQANTNINEIDFYLSQINEKIKQYQTCVIPAEEKTIDATIKKNYQKLKTKVNTCKESLCNAIRKIETEYSGKDAQIREKLVSLLSNLKSKTVEMQEAYERYNKILKNKVVRQVKLIDLEGNMNEAKIRKEIDSNPDTVGKLIQNKIMGKASNKLKNTAQDIIEKCDSIKILQRNVKDLLGMIMEISEIMKLQTGKIEAISENVFEAKAKMIKANDNLVRAKKHQQSAKCVL